MKYFKIEPTYKKSLVEHYVFRRPLSDLTDDGPEGNIATLTKEIGWRWGDFIATVPETEDEITEWLSYRDDGAYSNFYDLAIDYGLTETDENGEEVLPPSKSIQEMIEGLLLPDLDDDFVQITEDYPEAEMQSTWDGCWEDWTLNTGYKGPELENLESIIGLIAASVKTVYFNDDTYNIGKAEQKDLMSILNDLTTTQFSTIQQYFETMPKVRKDINFTCSSCETENNQVLEGLASFF
mgnify:CR=1 FL=1